MRLILAAPSLRDTEGECGKRFDGGDFRRFYAPTVQ